MIDSKSVSRAAEASSGRCPWKQRGVLGAICALAIGAYAYMAQSGVLELVNQDSSETYYNLLVQGFRAGQLNLKKEVPAGFARLADPYDPAANAVYQRPPYRMLDLSYYKGKLYLYFGATPALILFWPYVALTGQYLFHQQAVAIFCTVGFLASVGLLYGLWRRYFADVSVGVVASCALALGLATGVPVLLSSADVYEAAISCGYMLTMLALGGIWRALHEPERQCRWLAAASMAYGLAVGARPSLLFGAAILLVPVAHAWRERRRAGIDLLAAIGPIVVIGLGLMLYNVGRFGNPFEFGQHYQLSAERQTGQLFSLRYLWFNFRVYFLELARWSLHSPFVQGAAVPPLPAGYWSVRNSFGVLACIPMTWLTLALPLAWRNRQQEARRTLRCFVMSAALVFGVCALVVCAYFCANFRYAVDFLPALILLAVVGILGFERALVDRPLIWRIVLRLVWGLMVAFSVAFNLLATVGYHAEAHNSLGTTLARLGRTTEAIQHYEQALRLKPDYAEVLNNLGSVMRREGKLEEAMQQYRQALRIEPHNAEAHNNLGLVFDQEGKLQDAVEQYEQALWSEPNFANAHYNLGVAFVRSGRLPEAMTQWEQALKIAPDYADAHNNLANALLEEGRLDEAIKHYERAIQSKPDLAEAHCNLGVTLEQAGRPQDALEHYEQALRIKPDYAQARNAIARLQARQ